MARQFLYVCPQIEKEVLRMIGEGASYVEMTRALNIKDHVIVAIKRKNGLLPPVPHKKTTWWAY